MPQALWEVAWVGIVVIEPDLFSRVEAVGSQLVRRDAQLIQGVRKNLQNSIVKSREGEDEGLQRARKSGPVFNRVQQSSFEANQGRESKEER